MANPKGLLFDVTTCTLCGACCLADKERNALPASAGELINDELSDTSFLVVKKRQGRGVRFSCMHCLNPTCVSACPVGALQKTDIGAVVYHRERCIGCRYCLMACPFSVPKYEWGKQLPYVRKCDLCHSRIVAGQQPACSAACPSGALVYGDRNMLLREAHGRINAHPGRYVDHIYGENEVGGTSLLILSDIPLDRLGYPAGITDVVVPSLTGAALNSVPKIAFLGGALLVGLFWLTERRNEVLAEQRTGRLSLTESDADEKEGK